MTSTHCLGAPLGRTSTWGLPWALKRLADRYRLERELGQGGKVTTCA